MTWLRKLLGNLHQTSLVQTGAQEDRQAGFADEPEYTNAQMQEALDRRTRSVARLQRESVPVLQSLPVIEPLGQASIRSVQDVADRAVALALISAQAIEPDREAFDAAVRKRDMESRFTPNERAFLSQTEPSERARIQLSWRCEAAEVLLWALQQGPEALGRPDHSCDPARVVDAVRDEARLTEKGLRPVSQILDEADLIYRYHWAARNADLKGEAAPAGLDMGVIMERHHALNWLVGYCALDWDDVTTDT